MMLTLTGTTVINCENWQDVQTLKCRTSRRDRVTSRNNLAAGGLLGALSSADSGGLDLGLPGAARIVRRLAEECGSMTMILTTHYCGAAVLKVHGAKDVRTAAASGSALEHTGVQRSGVAEPPWAPVGTAAEFDEKVQLNASKSWITSAAHATAYIWSSRPLAADGASTIWLVSLLRLGFGFAGPFEGLRFRGNDSSPVAAANVQVPRSAMLSADGQGFEVMRNIVLPVFAVLSTP